MLTIYSYATGCCLQAQRSPRQGMRGSTVFVAMPCAANTAPNRCLDVDDSTCCTSITYQSFSAGTAKNIVEPGYLLLCQFLSAKDSKQLLTPCNIVHTNNSVFQLSIKVVSVQHISPC
eukprot:GHRR01015929.1.p1 GENE.GHRR01015929.1~~GHRR01015929.1.p1  ORF type:complete len:118 (-),score=15.96 GHRR01015929.1:1894-2247(-)